MGKISLTSKRLFLLVFIVLSLLVIVPTECVRTSTVIGSTYKVDDDLEVQAMAQITQYIYDCSVASGYVSYNWFGSEATQDHIFDAAEGVGGTYSISFFIGHGNAGIVLNGIVPEWQYWVRVTNGDRVYDREIYPYSECQHVRFVFLWSCKQGNTIGGKHWFSQTHYGMPYAWLHTTDLSTDGYASPDNNGYCFIGFDGDAPYLTETINGRYGVGYYFLGYFYAAALCGDKTINEALDYASQKMWSVDFDESVLYDGIPDCGKMVVYGDGNLNVGTSVTAPTLTPAPPFEKEEGGGGAPFCPTLFVWNGSQYAEEAFLDIHADSDVTLQHAIAETLVPDKNSYKLSVRELDNFTSHIDQVKLHAVDSDGAMHETHLTNAVHSDLGDVKELLLHDDDTRVDLTPEQTIDLNFTVANMDDVAYFFIFEINGFNQKTPGDTW